jgi:DNA polymerase type B, organellar and viral
VFTDYVKDLYNIKSTTNDSVEKEIVKRLLNHLLGRFGMNIVKPITKLVGTDELSLIFSTREVLGKPTKVTDNDYWVTYNSQIDSEICAEHGVDYIKVCNLTSKTDVEKLNEFKDVSLTTAAAVTAYARIYMSKVKENILNKGGNNLVFYG